MPKPEAERERESCNRGGFLNRRALLIHGVFLTLCVLFLTDKLMAKSEGVLFATWDPWGLTGCRAGGLDGNQDGYLVKYDKWFRVSEARRLEAGQEKDLWQYEYEKSGRLSRVKHLIGYFLLESGEYGPDGRLFRKHEHQGLQKPFSSQEYVYGHDGRLMVIKWFRGQSLEKISEVRYHPSGQLWQEVITNGGNAVIGRVLYELDEAGRIREERHFLWGWLVKTITCNYCPHGFLAERSELVPSQTDRIRDPFFSETLIGMP